MRFRNYMNRKNRKNRIYSEEDLLKMQLGNLFDIEEDILAQDDEIGIPTLEELEQSPNTEWIEPYINEDGIEDGGFWQSVLTPMKERNYPQTEPTDSFAPESPLYKLSAIEVADNLNTEDEEEKWEPSEYQLEGGVSKTRVPVVTDIADEIKNTAKKYEGLDILTAGQKAASKVSPAVYGDYYGLSSRFNDGDEVPERILKENDIVTLSDIQDKEQYDKYAEIIAKSKGLDINNPETTEQIKNTKIVTPKEQSRLYESIKNTEAFENWVANNYEKIQKGDNSYNQSIEFPLGKLKTQADRNAAGTIHKADMKNARVNEDGSMTVDLRDWYDFANMKDKNIWNKENIKNPINTVIYNKVARANNRAYNQQEKDKLENYLIGMPINVSKEELEEMLKRRRMKRL